MDQLPANLSPNMIIAVDSEFETTIVKYENKAEQRFSADTIGSKIYKFRWIGIDATKYSSLLSFFNSQRGEFKAWTFSDSRLDSGASITMRFNQKRLNMTPRKFIAFDVDVEVIVCQ